MEGYILKEIRTFVTRFSYRKQQHSPQIPESLVCQIIFFPNPMKDFKSSFLRYRYPSTKLNIAFKAQVQDTNNSLAQTGQYSNNRNNSIKHTYH